MLSDSPTAIVLGILAGSLYYFFSSHDAGLFISYLLFALFATYHSSVRYRFGPQPSLFTGSDVVQMPDVLPSQVETAVSSLAQCAALEEKRKETGSLGVTSKAACYVAVKVNKQSKYKR
jgi:hypothetical protein